MIFRQYGQEDLSALSDMIHALYREDPGGETIDDRKITDTVNEHTIHPEKLNIIIFEDDDQILGYALLVYAWSNEYGGDILHVDELYVQEAYRDQGIGAAFFHFIEETMSPAALQLEVAPSNRKALVLYNRLGFIPSGNTHLIKKHR